MTDRWYHYKLNHPVTICPKCGGDPDRARFVFGGCICPREPKQDNGGPTIEDLLAAAGKADYITPAAELTGINKYVLFVLAIFLIALIFVSRGILWG